MFLCFVLCACGALSVEPFRVEKAVSIHSTWSEHLCGQFILELYPSEGEGRVAALWTLKACAGLIHICCHSPMAKSLQSPMIQVQIEVLAPLSNSYKTEGSSYILSNPSH